MFCRNFLIALALLVSNTFSHADGSSPLKILCYGDSITAKGKWVGAVDADKRYQTINAGVSGRRAAWAVKQLKPYLEEHQEIDIIIMFLGVNDLPSRDKRPGEVKVAGCVSNMSEAIDLAMSRVEAENIILVAPCGVNPEAMSANNLRKGYDATPPLLTMLESDYAKLAEEKGTKFLSLLNVVSKENFSDGLHPNNAGDDEIAKAVLKFLNDNF